MSCTCEAHVFVPKEYNTKRIRNVKLTIIITNLNFQISKKYTEINEKLRNILEHARTRTLHALYIIPQMEGFAKQIYSCEKSFKPPY